MVELSIVLVILGLLVGGILAGQSLIRASELRAVGAEHQRWLTATNAFRDKYMGIPGDFGGATRFWGRQNSSSYCMTNSAAAITANGVCDGNSNGALGNPQAAGEPGKSFQFWRHLAAAGMIEGVYTGLAGSGGQFHAVINENIPGSRLTGGGWGALNWNLSNGTDGAFYSLDYGNYFLYGSAMANNTAGGRILTPAEAWNIDTKIDDGKPARGKIVAIYWNNGCAVADDGSSSYDDFDASYRLAVTSVQCALIFRQQF